MPEEKREGELDFGGIAVDKKEVYRYMGIPRRETPAELRPAVDRLISDAARICRPRFCYRIFPLTGSSFESITVSDTTFRTGKIISPFYREAEYCLVYVVTSGREFDVWTKGFSASGDIMGAFITDSIGSEIAEAASRKMLGDAEAGLKQQGLMTGNSYSPGYCGWDVAEQAILFSLLPPSPAGVTLNGSALMSPVKSVSGIVPVGNRVTKMPYGCAVCDRKNCYKKRI